MNPALLVSEIFPPKTGGSGRWFWEVYRRLPQDACLIAAGEDPRQDDFDATHQLNVVRTPLTLPEWGISRWRGLKDYSRAIRQLNRLARTNRVSQVHCGRCLPEGLMALALKWWRRTPYVCYVHGEDVNTARHSREHALLVRQVLRGARLNIANSHNTKRLLVDDWNVPESRVEVLHPGVDTDRFVPAEPCEAVRGELGWSGRAVVLTVGRLQQRKGHDRLIQALPQIRRAIPSVLYVIVGEGEQDQRLREMVEQLSLQDHVQFRGEIDDDQLVRCYQQCDLFALPNRDVDGDIEGFGMVLLEAQACQKPVLAGASGGTRETMRIPQTGRVVDCDDVDTVARHVSELLRDEKLRRRMGRAAREWVVGTFDWNALVAQARRLFAA